MPNRSTALDLFPDSNEDRPASPPGTPESRRLQAKYQELLEKYRAAAERRSHSHSIGQWLLHHAQEGVAILGAGSIRVANRRFYTWYGPARRWSFLQHPELARNLSMNQALGILEQQFRAEGSQSALTFLLRSERPELCYLEAEMQWFGDSGDVMVLMRDITDAQLLRQHKEESEQRDQFLAMLAHELRNPLAPIVSSAELLLRTSDPERVEALARRVLDQARHQARLVEDLLDAARVRRGKISLRQERMDLRAVLQDAADATESSRLKRRHRFHLELPEHPVEVEADRARLLQVTVNLLYNACKFTPDEGEIHLRLEADRQRATVTVRDTGVGIDAETLPRIWDLFEQAETSLDRSQGGLGLGLALVKSLISMHGGGVRAESEGLGQGAMFRYWLPLPPHPLTPSPAAWPAEPVSQGAPPPAAAVQSILVVEDNQAARESLCELLEEAGFEVRCAGSGGAALELAREKKPDAVVTDIGLPGMDGFTLGERLRAEQRELLLIALSGYSRAEDLRRARELGFDAYLVKPLDVAALFRHLRAQPREAL